MQGCSAILLQGIEPEMRAGAFEQHINSIYWKGLSFCLGGGVMNFSPLRPEQKLVCPSREKKKFNCGFFFSHIHRGWHGILGKLCLFPFFSPSARCEKQRVPFCFLRGYQGLYLCRLNNATSRTLQ